MKKNYKSKRAQQTKKQNTQKKARISIKRPEPIEIPGIKEKNLGACIDSFVGNSIYPKSSKKESNIRKF